MASVAGICSNALRKLGDQPITALTDDSDRARNCNNIYPEIRDELLEARNWNFATERKSLARISTAPAFTWSYQYSLPADCLRPIRLQYIDEDYVIEGRNLLTDAETVNLIYLKQVTDPNQFTPSFIIALEARMAAELAYPITGDMQLQVLWTQKAELKLKDAAYQDAISQGTPNQFHAETLINSRRGNNSGYSVGRIDL